MRVGMDTGSAMGMIFDALSFKGELSGVLDSAGLLYKRSSDGDNALEQYSRSHFSYFTLSEKLAGLMDWRLYDGIRNSLMIPRCPPEPKL
jgi:hypothetical protein